MNSLPTDWKRWIYCGLSNETGTIGNYNKWNYSIHIREYGWTCG